MELFFNVYFHISAVFCAMVTLLLAAVLQPSIPSSIYYLIFLFAGTLWSFYREIDRIFAILCRSLLVFLVIHIAALLTYQTPWPQEKFGVNDTIIRYNLVDYTEFS